LFARLDSDDIAAVEAAVTPEEGVWCADAEGREQHLIVLGVWHGIASVMEKTGLVAAEPPPKVHAMSRGPLAAGGDLYSADMVVEAAEDAGRRMPDVRRALDFGCSSGRTLRPLAAAWPDVEWHGVDPNEGAVAWAARHVPGALFQPSPSDPPLPFPDAHFDLVYAISIWSHFNEWAARAWLDEMWRLIAPSGLLVFTVHGAQSVAYYGQHGLRPPAQLNQIQRELYRRGFWYAPEFGKAGDHGVAHPEWGTSFISPEWLLRTVSGAWEVITYAVGRNADNQDLVVLRRAQA
jgi:SAM-dependent methyltransferase